MSTNTNLYNENPISEVTVCLMDEEDRMLILFDTAKDEWTLPTWKVNITDLPRENAEQMIESLLNVNIELDEGDIFLRVPVTLDDETPSNSVYYVTEEWDGEIQNVRPEVYSNIAWFDGENLPEGSSKINPMTVQAYAVLHEDGEYDEDNCACC